MRRVLQGVNLAGLLMAAAFGAQQNPSPMVEHTREHLRLPEQTPPGRREKLELGTLFIPAALETASDPPLLFFFHGAGDWLPEVAAARNHMAVITIQVGAISEAYGKAFEDAGRFLALLREAEAKARMRFSPVLLGGWSAGCGAIRQILKSPESYARVDGALMIDGIHTDYVDGKPGPLESKLETSNLEIWLKLARDAIAGRKRAIITHSEIFPGTFASTTETADYLTAQLGLHPNAVVKWGPMGMQELSELRAGHFLLLGYAGNSAPDHVDQLEALPVLLRWLRGMGGR
ncbi:MAG TPA: hypothetical protein VME43_07370 [Bryobacteraceae bacterium]|nr:hypothetical protein [Bryobacteraceae bacterium]